MESLLERTFDEAYHEALGAMRPGSWKERWRRPVSLPDDRPRSTHPARRGAGGRFVGTAAVDDDLAIARQLAYMPFEAVHGQMQRAGNVSRLHRARGVRPH